MREGGREGRRERRAKKRKKIRLFHSAQIGIMYVWHYVCVTHRLPSM